MSRKSDLKIDITNYINYAKNPCRLWIKVHDENYWFTNDLAKNSVIMKLKLKKKFRFNNWTITTYEIVFTMFFKQNKQHVKDMLGNRDFCDPFFWKTLLKKARWPHKILTRFQYLGLDRITDIPSVPGYILYIYTYIHIFFFNSIKSTSD